MRLEGSSGSHVVEHAVESRIDYSSLLMFVITPRIETPKLLWPTCSTVFNSPYREEIFSLMFRWNFLYSSFCLLPLSFFLSLGTRDRGGWVSEFKIKEVKQNIYCKSDCLFKYRIKKKMPIKSQSVVQIDHKETKKKKKREQNNNKKYLLLHLTHGTVSCAL